MRSYNICFHGEIRKIIFELSSISALIWSSDRYYKKMIFKNKSFELQFYRALAFSGAS